MARVDRIKSQYFLILEHRDAGTDISNLTAMPKAGTDGSESCGKLDLQVRWESRVTASYVCKGTNSMVVHLET